MTWNEVVKQGYDQFMKRNEDLEYVVRCKDCKWFNDYEVECSLPIGLVYPNSDDYCSKGERKERSEDVS